MPDLKAGALFTNIKHKEYKWNYDDGEATWGFTQETNEQPEWFEPVYEPVHVVLNLSNGTVTINVDKQVLDWRGGEHNQLTESNIPLSHLEQLADYLQASNREASSRYMFGSREFTTLTFKLGC